ncbi:uncharacterized protein [Anabrus simplex]|uniref:uncharacterized protein n=1 Tax=Anabrus simplex TaxID=316456 RepID=UPI0035A3401A
MKKNVSGYWQKLFSRKKFKLAIFSVIFVGIFFICYQILFVKLLSDAVMYEFVKNGRSNTNKTSFKREGLSKAEGKNEDIFVNIRGIKLSDGYKYKPNFRGKFVCFDTKEEIDYDRINDDYCDCISDGSDEPGTNACHNGKFHCETQQSRITVLPSNRVNDGICDCCDGSDEWAQIFPVHRLDEIWQKKLGRYQSPCPNLCPANV